MREECFGNKNGVWVSLFSVSDGERSKKKNANKLRTCNAVLEYAATSDASTFPE